MAAMKRVISLFPMLWGNWISLLGTTLATIAGNTILIVFVLDVVTGIGNPYASAFAYLMMPPMFVVGLALIAIGIWRHRRRRRDETEGTPLEQAVGLVLANPSSRRRVFFVVIATLINITLISMAAIQGVSYMNTTRFCGQLCHSVMEPEYTAYVRSPHARVPCVDCHIGAGASWFVRSKLSGVRQVWATMTDDFSRPVPTPVHHLRPARETCERCHWPAKFHGERLIVRHQYKPDKTNTRETNVVRLNVGGENLRSLKYEGIHWHVAPHVKIEYEALDNRRASIGKVVMTYKGKSTTFLPPKEKRGSKVVERRTMDCVDCHNRPTHIYDPSPEVAVDRSLTLGKLDAELPFLRREGVALLKRKVAQPDQAAKVFTDALQNFYRRQFPEVTVKKAAAVQRAGRELAWIYRRNVYPRMNIGWNTYPNHIGHRNTNEGCFRCHDDEHTSTDKEQKTISQDCDVCHEVLAQEEEKPDVPPNVLKLGNL